MRILTVSNCMLSQHEGSGQVVLNFSSGLRHAGHTVDAFGPDSYSLANWVDPRARSLRQVAGMLPFTLRQLRKHSYDILEIYGGEGWLTFLWLSKFLKKRPLLVFHSNGVEPHVESVFRSTSMIRHPWWHVNQTSLMNAGFRAADYLVTVSNFDREFALEQGYLPPEKVVTIHPGLHPTFHNQPFVAHREPVIGYCGNWIPLKGSLIIAEALPHVLRSHRDSRLLLVGVGNQFQKQDWFPDDVLGQVEVVPFVTEKSTLKDLYKRMQIAIMPSYFESFGLAAAEAMATGAALVANRIGIASELKHGKEAWIIDGSESNSLAKAICGMLADPILRTSISEGGWRFSQRLKWESAQAKLEFHYAAWLNQNRT